MAFVDLDGDGNFDTAELVAGATKRLENMEKGNKALKKDVAVVMKRIAGATRCCLWLCYRACALCSALCAAGMHAADRAAARGPPAAHPPPTLRAPPPLCAGARRDVEGS